MNQMDRKTLLERAGVGAGVLALPALFGAEAALAGSPPNSRIALWIVVSRAAAAQGPVLPTIAWGGMVAFRPEQEFIKGGGNFQIFDFNKSVADRTPIVTGGWTATEFISWTARTIGSDYHIATRSEHLCELKDCAGSQAGARSANHIVLKTSNGVGKQIPIAAGAD